MKRLLVMKNALSCAEGAAYTSIWFGVTSRLIMIRKSPFCRRPTCNWVWLGATTMLVVMRKLHPLQEG
jgi:hypothetical protein